MTRKTTRAMTLIALLSIGAGAGIANASGGNRGHDHGHRHSATCGCEVQAIAGYLTIDGRTTTITSDRGRNAQIVRAFRKAGYDAWIHDGCVRVDYGYCKPSVRWRTDDYAAALRWSCGTLRVSLSEIRRYEYRPVRVQRSFRYGYRGRICD